MSSNPTACAVSAVTQAELTTSFIAQPNPVFNELTINIDLKEQADKMTVTVYNMLGQVVSNKVFTNVMTEQIRVDMSTENAGIYFVSVNADGVVATKKVIK